MTRCSKDESSSSEEPPRVNMAGLRVLPLLGMSLEEGWTWIPELLGFRKDEATEKSHGQQNRFGSNRPKKRPRCPSCDAHFGGLCRQ